MTWSVSTLLLALNVIAILCALYITVKAYQQSLPWGLFFFFTPVAYYALSRVVGPLIAGVVVIGAQIYFIRQPYNRKTLGRVYIYMVLCWAGATAISIRASGWIPRTLMASKAEPVVEQAGTEVPAVEAQLPVDGGAVWYRRSGTGHGTPVILLHGGPGISSFYLKPLEGLGDDRPVVRYDQLGSGKSTPAHDTTLFNIAHFVAELDSLRLALGYDKVHLVGHSWGTILGFEYYRKHPENVASLTLASPALSSPEWTRNARKLVLTLSDSAQRAIREREALGDFDAPDYINAVNEFYARYVWLRPVEADMDSTMKTMSRAIYSHMWGPSEFSVTGTLKSYDATRLLKSIKVPTLYTVGQFDEADTTTVKKFAARTPGAKVEIIPDAAHVTTWDNPEVMLNVVRAFLRGVDAPPVAPAPPPTP